MYINDVNIMGYVAENPVDKQDSKGECITHFVVVTVEKWTDPVNGEPREREQYHNILVLSHKVAEFAVKHVTKRSHVHVNGILRTSKNVDAYGNVSYTTKVVVCSPAHHVLLLKKSEKKDGLGPDVGGR